MASPDYVAGHCIPTSVDALKDGHRMVGFHSSATDGLQPLEFTVDGEIQSLTLPATLSVSAAESYVAAARLGLGLIQVPRYHADAALTSGELFEILPAHPPTATPVSLLYPSSRQLSPRVRIFIDWVAKQFAAN